MKITKNIESKSFLVTGGAGFIGSNIVRYLIKNNAKKVYVIDDLSNGKVSNLNEFINDDKFEFIESDIRDYKQCELIIEKVDYVCHQAALGSVPRSLKNPLLSHDVNVNGFLNILNAIKNLNRDISLVYASSSSVYGDSKHLPKVENNIGNVLSPYALTKKNNEQHAKIFYDCYGVKSIGLRYFNVFGPYQDYNNPYAAVIPIFCNAFINKNSPVVYGTGETSRDFTYIENVIQANIKSLFYLDSNNCSEIFNVGCGDQYSLNTLLDFLTEISSYRPDVIYEDFRDGDVLHSNACIKKAKNILNYNPIIPFYEGLKLTYNWNKKIIQ